MPGGWHAGFETSDAGSAVLSAVPGDGRAHPTAAEVAVDDGAGDGDGALRHATAVKAAIAGGYPCRPLIPVRVTGSGRGSRSPSVPSTGVAGSVLGTDVAPVLHGEPPRRADAGVPALSVRRAGLVRP